MPKHTLEVRVHRQQEKTWRSVHGWVYCLSYPDFQRIRIGSTTETNLRQALDHLETDMPEGRMFWWAFKGHQRVKDIHRALKEARLENASDTGATFDIDPETALNMALIVTPTQIKYDRVKPARKEPDSKK